MCNEILKPVPLAVPKSKNLTVMRDQRFEKVFFAFYFFSSYEDENVNILSFLDTGSFLKKLSVQRISRPGRSSFPASPGKWSL